GRPNVRMSFLRTNRRTDPRQFGAFRDPFRKSPIVHDSNLQPDRERSALTIELRARCVRPRARQVVISALVVRRAPRPGEAARYAAPQIISWHAPRRAT